MTSPAARDQSSNTLRPALTVDPAVFDPDAISPETRALNAAIVAAIEAAPDRWTLPPETIRRMRAETGKPFPLAPKSPRAEPLEIDGPGGTLRLRVIRPQGEPTGMFLHIHGGGWMVGAADQQDPMLERIADNTGLIALSVDYRLAPESPYPAAQDDCEAAALWLVSNGQNTLGANRFLIGGESAGAHLSVTTLMRLRDRHGLTPFAGAALEAGCYDLRLTPSARNWGAEKLVLNTRDIRMFIGHFIPADQDLETPDISPLLGDLSGMPPALFTVGTRDALVDDSTMMASRWLAAGNRAELAVWPGGCHAFTLFPGGLSEAANTRIDQFLTSI